VKPQLDAAMDDTPVVVVVGPRQCGKSTLAELLAGIESKLTASVRARDFNGLRHLRDRLGERFGAGIVVHTGPDTLPFGDRLWAVPISALWTPA
jgi:predicted AAA+ superfamily ATPase